jgi:hypothetical protein
LNPKVLANSIFTVQANLTGLPFQPVNPSPITEYGMYPPENTMIGCRWNNQQPMNAYFFNAAPGVLSPVKLTYGTNSTHPMLTAMKALIGETHASAARTFVSGAGAIQSRAYYPDNGAGATKFVEEDRIQFVSFNAPKPEHQKDVSNAIWVAGICARFSCSSSYSLFVSHVCAPPCLTAPGYLE